MSCPFVISSKGLFYRILMERNVLKFDDFFPFFPFFSIKNIKMYFSFMVFRRRNSIKTRERRLGVFALLRCFLQTKEKQTTKSQKSHLLIFAFASITFIFWCWLEEYQIAFPLCGTNELPRRKESDTQFGVCFISLNFWISF